jgi:hypothetical protein
MPKIGSLAQDLGNLNLELTHVRQEVESLRKQLFPAKKEFVHYAPNGVISHLTAMCGGNVHDKGAVEITASSVGPFTWPPQNAAYLGPIRRYAR